MKEIPLPSKRRLVLLERLLSSYGEKNITSQKIQDLTGWSSSLVRRDINLLEIKCGASNGYRVSELKAALGGVMNGSGREKRCCIVGLGRMGQALLDNFELEETQFKLVAGFDSNVNRTEVLHSVFPLHPTTMLESVIKSEQIEYAILTVESTEEAKSVADRLSRAGVRGIVNYNPCVLTVQGNTKVENVSLLTALQTLALEAE